MDMIAMTDRTENELTRVKIVKIYWERVNLFMEIETEYSADGPGVDELDFFLVDAQFGARAQFYREMHSESAARLSLNITNPGNCRCLPPGRYQMWACRGSEILASVEIDTGLASSLLDHSRAFLYNGKTQSYIVSLSVGEDENHPALIIDVLDSKRIKAPLSAKLKRIIACTMKTAFNAYYRTLHWWYRTVSPAGKKKTILFLEEQNSNLSATIRVLHERMKQRGLDKEFNILFCLSKGEIWQKGIRYCLGTLRKIALADQIYVEDHTPTLAWLILADDTQLVQLWHAGAGYKSVGYSRWGHPACPAPFGSHRQYDYGITPGANIAHFFSEVFGINTEQILPTGMPRMDEYLSEEYRREKTAELFEKYPQIRGKKVILFAPTYRGSTQALAYYPYNMIDFDALYDFCGDEYIVWFKMHPWVMEPVPISERHSDRFFDMTQYPNIDDLFYVTDVFIGDYSSNVFEFSFMDKPMLFYAYDEAQYSAVRGFHRDYRSSIPGKLCHSFDEVLESLRTGDYAFEKLTSYRKEHIDNIDTHASDRVIDWFVLGNIPEEYIKRIDSVREAFRHMESMDFSCLGQ